MRLSALTLTFLTFVAAGGACLVAANSLVRVVEDATEIGIRTTFDDKGLDWAEVQADGLQVIVSGTAPTEALRFAALTTAGRVVDAARVLDQIDVTPSADLAPPRFSAEVLRNRSGIQIIGLLPQGTDRAALVSDLEGIAPVSDFLEVADYPVPRGLTEALAFAKVALNKLPRSKVSVDAEGVAITAIADSPEAKAALEAELNRRAPEGLKVVIEISAPRPVITPFTLRFLIDQDGPRFDACAADTEETRTQLLDAAKAAGLESPPGCTLGLGVPSPDWGKAGSLAIAALAELGAGSVTFSDADVTLVAAQGTLPGLFDRVVGELETALPDVFALHAVLPEPEKKDDQGPIEFTATRSPEGQVQLRGRLSDDALRLMADSYAKSRFGTETVYTATRIAPDLPPDWPERVLAGLEALTYLKQGAVVVAPTTLSVRGISQQENATAAVSGLLSERLGETGDFTLEIAYQEPPPPRDIPPTPEECEARLQTVQVDQKIGFEPGSATIDEGSLGLLGRLAEILDECGDLSMEIQGHTDSQGRESMNLELSQARADAVLAELRNRRVLTANFTAVGYGEKLPIATNRTEDGREANRRIEFRLIRPEPTQERESALDAVAAEQDEEAEDGQN